MTSKCSRLCEHQRRWFCFAAFTLQDQTLRSLYLMRTLDAGGSSLSAHHLSLRAEPSQTKVTHKRNLHFVKLAHTSKDAVKVNASVNFCLYLEGGAMHLGYTYTNI